MSVDENRRRLLGGVLLAAAVPAPAAAAPASPLARLPVLTGLRELDGDAADDARRRLDRPFLNQTDARWSIAGGRAFAVADLRAAAWEGLVEGMEQALRSGGARRLADSSDGSRPLRYAVWRTGRLRRDHLGVVAETRPARGAPVLAYYALRPI